MNLEAQTQVAQVRRVRVAMLLCEQPSAADVDLLDELAGTEYVYVETVVLLKDGARTQGVSIGAQALIRLYQWMEGSLGSTDANNKAVSETGRAADGNPRGIVTVGTNEGITEALLGHEIDVIICPTPIEGMRLCAGCAHFGLWWMEPVDPGCVQNLYLTSTADLPLTAFLYAARETQREPFCLEFGCVPLVSSISVAKNLKVLTALRRNVWLSALRTLSLQGWEALCAKGAEQRQSLQQDGLLQEARRIFGRHESSAAAVGRALVHMGVRQLRHRFRQSRRVEAWKVGVRPIRDGGSSVRDTRGYRWLEAPAGHWYADPFLLSTPDRELLYMEDFDQAANKGRIVCGELDARGRLTGLEPVLERRYHVAYPYVFEHDGEIFMIPETGFNNTVELYRCTMLPFGWELVRELYTGPVFDTSLLHHDGRFWFFTSLVKDDSRQVAQLLLFQSDRIDGDWTAHPLNPLSNDARFARGGGGIARLDSRLVRPAQDGSHTYGGAVQLRSVETLNEREYAETSWGAITPARLPNAVGLHTYNKSVRMEVIDCRLRTLRRD